MTEEYRSYMNSEAWEKKKQERIDIDKGCVMCGRPIEKIRLVNVHHVTYARLGRENVETDLCTLCGTCHKLIHNYYNRYRGENSGKN